MAPNGRKHMSELEKRQLQNRIAGIIIPLVLLGIVAYASWVVVSLIAVQYLLRGELHYGITNRPGPGIAIIVLYFVFLFLPTVSYLRLLDSTRHPGFVEKGKHMEVESAPSEKRTEHHPSPGHNNTTAASGAKPHTSTNDLSNSRVADRGIRSKRQSRNEGEWASYTSSDDTMNHSPLANNEVSNNAVSEQPPSTARDTERHPPASRQSTHGTMNSAMEKPSIGPHGQLVTTLNLEAIFKGEVAPPPGLEKYYSKEVFVCGPNGLPIWCGTCANWKPDRSHHCTDVGRCVMKLDHFCPWVGGVVAENNFKFFIQFTFYAYLYTMYILIVMAYFWHDRSSRGFGVNGNWLAILILSVVFTLFTGGMTGTSIQFAIKNTTTIDNINSKSRTMYLAVHIDDPDKYYQSQAHSSSGPTSSLGGMHPHTPQPSQGQVSQVSHPRKSSETHNSLKLDGFEKGECAQLMFQGSRPKKQTTSTIPQTPAEASTQHPWCGTITYPLYVAPITTIDGQVGSVPPLPPPRTFVILRTHPGMNPWDLGLMANWRQIMGTSIWSWWLPLRRSPCATHTAGDSLYALGEAVERLKRDAGISEESEVSAPRRDRPDLSNDSLVSSSAVTPMPIDVNGSTLAVVNGVSGRERIDMV